MITSRLTSKAQTTVPQAVRKALRLQAGDELVYRIEGDRVILSKSLPRSPVGQGEEDPFALFDEWSSEADRRAYRDL
jgi:antitoxin PrlF